MNFFHCIRTEKIEIHLQIVIELKRAFQLVRILISKAKLEIGIAGCLLRRLAETTRLHRLVIPPTGRYY